MYPMDKRIHEKNIVSNNRYVTNPRSRVSAAFQARVEVYGGGFTPMSRDGSKEQ